MGVLVEGGSNDADAPAEIHGGVFGVGVDVGWV